jgi:hypothetical protein
VTRAEIRMQIWYYEHVYRRLDDVCMWLAWKLPRRLAFWCYIRVVSHATILHSDLTPDELTFGMISRAWDRKL